MARILFLIDTAGPGGAETVYVDLVSGFAEAGHEVIPLLPEDGWVAAALRRRGLEPLFDDSVGSADVRYLGRLVRRIRRGRVDLVHAHLLTSGVYGSVAARLCGVPAVVTFHGLPDLGRRTRFLRLKCALLNRGAARFVFVSRSLREAVLARTPLASAKAAVIHNGIALPTERGLDPALRAELAGGASGPLVVAVGNIRPAKGYEILLRATRRVLDAGQDCRVAIVGHEKQPLAEELRTLRRELRLDETVMFAGFHDDADAVLRAADLFVLASHTEGFSLATVQAMAAGTPVVATRSGGPEELLDDRTTGRLVPPGDPEALAAAMLESLREPEAARAMAARAATVVRARFTVDAMREAYRRLYAEVAPTVQWGTAPVHATL